MDGEKSSRRLFVGGLFQGITEQDLKDRFSRFGNVSGVDIRARKDNLGTILKTFAYLDMSISERDYRKCVATFNNTKWHGNEMQIQIAKESFVDRLKKEREEASKMKTAPEKMASMVEPVDLLVKGAVPGTAVDGKKDWVVGKYGRALPVVNIRTKNKKKVVTVDPSKYVHGVKHFDHGKKAIETEETQSPVNGLTWHMDVEETDITKKIKGEFPSPKVIQKRKHINESVQKNVQYVSSSDSCSSDEKSLVMKKRKGKPENLLLDQVSDKSDILSQQSLSAKVKHKKAMSGTSTPTQSSRLADISTLHARVIEPFSNSTLKASNASTILQQLKLSSQKKLISSSSNGLKRTTANITDSASAEDVQVSNKNINTTSNKRETAKPKIVPAQRCSDSSSAEDEKVVQSDISTKKIYESTCRPNVLAKTDSDTRVKTNIETKQAASVCTPKTNFKTRTPMTYDSSSSEDELERRKMSNKESKSTQFLQAKSTTPKDMGSKPSTIIDLGIKEKGKGKTPSSTTLTIERETTKKSSQKVKRKMSPVVASPIAIQFDADIGCNADDDDYSPAKPTNTRKRCYRHTLALQQPDFAKVGSVDEFGVGMLVDGSVGVASEIERNWNKYKPNDFSSDEDLLDAAAAGKFNKLDGIAKIAALRQKYIDIPSFMKSVSLTPPRVYNSDSDDSDENEEAFQKVQQAPKRVKPKTAQVVQSVKIQPVVEKIVHMQKKASRYSSDSDDEKSTDDDSRFKKAKGSSPKKLVYKKSNKQQAEESSSDDEAHPQVIAAIASKKVCSVSSELKGAQVAQKIQARRMDGMKKTMNEHGAESSSAPSDIESSELESLTSDVSDSDNEEITPKLQIQQPKVNNKIVKGTKDQNSKALSEIKLDSTPKKVVASLKQKFVVSSSESDNSSESPTEKNHVPKTVIHNMLTNRKSSSGRESSDSDTEQVTKKPKLQAGVAVRMPENPLSESDSSEPSTEHKSPKKPYVANSKGPKTTKSSSSDSDSSSESNHQSINPDPKNKMNKQQNSKSSTSSESSESETEQAKPETKGRRVVQAREASSGSSDSNTSDSEACQVEPIFRKIAASKPDLKKTVIALPCKKANKPKLTKRFGDANQQRLDSLKQRTQETLAQKSVLKQALASVDSDTSKSKKIIFDSDSEDEKMVTIPTPTPASNKRPAHSSSSDSELGDSSNETAPKQKLVITPQIRMAKVGIKMVEKRLPLFAEESGESEKDDEDRFSIRPQFEGKAGSKLISMQSRFGNDPRFKFTERFLDSDAEDDSAEDSRENDAESENMGEETSTDRDRAMAILNDIVGGKQAKKNKPVVFKDIALRQYDPTKDEHKQFEVEVKKKEKKKKGVPVEEAEAEPEPVPEVSDEKYFEVPTSLKDIFNTAGDNKKPFSLLDMLGRPKDRPAEKPNLQQEDGMGSLLKHVKSPWQQQFGSDDDSSEDEHGMDLDGKSEPEAVTDRAVKFPADMQHGFFFIEDDPRIAEGIDFFRRQGNLEEIRVKWTEERPELVEAYRNKRKRFKFMKRDSETKAFKPGGFRGGGRMGRRDQGRGRGGRQ